MLVANKFSLSTSNIRTVYSLFFVKKGEINNCKVKPALANFARSYSSTFQKIYHLENRACCKFSISAIMASKTALALLAAGAEEMELVITVDILRRAGIAVTVAGLDGVDPVKCSRDVFIKPDKSLADAAKSSYDVIVLPGGMGGSEALAASKEVGTLLKKQEKDGKYIAAICAAPALALKGHDIGKGKKATCYPSMSDKMKGDYDYQETKVVVDGKLITSRGPGTAFDFGLAITEELVGKEAAVKIAKACLLA